MNDKQRKILGAAFPELGLNKATNEDVSSGLTKLGEVLNKIPMVKGDKGEDGYTPIKGKDYFDGKDGYTPIKGKDYFDGKDGESIVGPRGPRGIPGLDGIGKDGKNGSPDTPEQVAEKLNTLTEAVDVSVIKGALTQDYVDDQNKKVLSGMKLIDGRIKLIDQRWGAHGGGLSKVSTDSTLTGIGTPSSPLSVVSSGSTLTAEVLTGTQDGSNNVFTVVHKPVFINNDGLIMTDGNGFTLSGTGPYTVTFDTAPAASPAPLQNFYNSGSGGGGGSSTFVDNEVVSGSGTAYTLASTPLTGVEHIYALGQRLYPTTDYSISGKNITTVSSWSAGNLIADYQTS